MFICAVILTAFFVRPAHAQAACFPNHEIAKTELAKVNEQLRFTVVMKMGALVHIYAGKTTMTMLIEQPNGMVCTGPALLGDILKNVQDPCA